MKGESGESQGLVVITGAESVTALITARSIRHLRCRIVGVTTDLWAAPTRSNVWSELHLTSPDLRAYLHHLVDLGTRLAERKAAQKPVLIVAQDPLVQLVAEHSGELSKYFEFVMPEADAIQRLLDKTAFHAWATAEGFPVPASTIVEKHAELDAALERGPYPLIVKPLVRTAAWDGPFPSLKFFTLNDIQTPFVHRERLFEYSPRYVVQQWIPGGDDEVYFCLAYFDRGGTPRAWYTGRKLLQWPLQTGSTAICVNAHAPEFEQMSLELLQRAGLKGLGSVEAKRNPLDGRFYVTEPTVGRNDFQSYVASVGGVNLSAYAALDGFNLPLPPSGRGRPALWFDELGALRGLRKSSERKNIWRSIKHARCGLNIGAALFSWRDPLPAVYRSAMEIKQGLRRLRGADRAAEESIGTRATHVPSETQLEVRLWTESEFCENAQHWEELMSRSECDRLFLSWAWQWNWWNTFGVANGLELRLYAAYRGGRLVGLAPLFRNVWRQRGVNIRRLQSIGNIWRGPMTMRTEYLDLIVDRAHKQEVTNALMTNMMDEEGWDELILTDLDLRSSAYSCLKRITGGIAIRVPVRYQSYEIRCEQSFSQYLASLSQNARRKLYGQRTKLQNYGAVRVEYFDAKDFSLFSQTLNELHKHRWGRPFFVGLMGEFHQSLLSIFERLGRARLSVMFVGEQAVSAMYSLIVDGREYHLQGGFNAQFARSVSLGSLHLGYSIERAFADGVQVIDLLVGGGRSTDFKRHFAIPLERSCLVQIVRSRRLRLAYGLLDAVRGSRRESLER